jgi:tRNA-splicing ligase RtcB
MNVIEGGRVPIKNWALATDESAMEQLQSLSRLPFIFHHVAAMPDVHWGNGTSVGTVFASDGAVIPSAVGVDIGCGMAALRTNIPKERVLDALPALRAEIERRVPVGSKSRKAPAATQGWVDWAKIEEIKHVDQGLIKKARLQCGTLGGGNHFIEVCLDEAGAVWVMLHSGSRNIGKTLAERHIENAKGIAKRYFIDLPDPQMAYLAVNTPEFGAYIETMAWCQAYALENREIMLYEVILALEWALGMEFGIDMKVNCHHNYVSQENHFGRNVWVTRKGAVRAREGDLGIIPGSMGTRSYIVRGLGNPESFHSCSHGAGRRMSRGEARRRFTQADLEAQTAGVECRKDADVIDEIPGAYKDIDAVMEQQKDLVEIVATLKQVLCVKG